MKQCEQPYQVEVTKVITYDEAIKDYGVCSHSIANASFIMSPIAEYVSKNMIVTRDEQGEHKLIFLNEMNKW